MEIESDTRIQMSEDLSKKDTEIETKEPTYGDVVLPLIKDHPELMLPWRGSKFDQPCPDNKDGDISQNTEINEWVFNHLPLSWDQKKDFLAMLIADQRKIERGDKPAKAEPRKGKPIRRKSKGIRKGPKSKEIIIPK